MGIPESPCPVRPDTLNRLLFSRANDRRYSSIEFGLDPMHAIRPPTTSKVSLKPGLPPPCCG